MALLELQDVRYAYGDHVVLDGISLRLDGGTTTAIVGPNGAGKTTLLRLAGGLLKPAVGRVLLEGHDLAAIPRRAAAQRLAGIPAEEEAIFPFSVRDTVRLGRHPWRAAFAPLSAEDEARVERALAETALMPLADRSVPSLSSGERQRAAIARCLVQDARVVLLDEPTAHLDLGQRLRMLRLFRAEARAHDSAVLAVLHDLNMAAVFADRILLLVGGTVLVDGSPDEVFTPEHIERAFGAPVQVLPHPQTGGPVIVPLTAEVPS